MSLPPELDSIVREYAEPVIRVRDGILTLCTSNDKRQQIAVTPGLWKTLWTPLTARNVTQLYRCLVIYLAESKNSTFDLATLPSTLTFTANPSAVIVDKLLLTSGETKHSIDLNAPSEEIKRLGIYDSRAQSIYVGVDLHTKIANTKVVIIPISYSYRAMERVRDTLLFLYKDTSFLRKEVKKLVPNGKVNKYNVISIPVDEPSLYVKYRHDFNYILIDRGTVFFRQNSIRAQTDPIHRVREYATPLLRNLIALEVMTHHLYLSGLNDFYLSPEVQEAVDKAVMDRRFSVDATLVFTPNLRYTIDEKAPDRLPAESKSIIGPAYPRSAYLIFTAQRRDSMKREHPGASTTEIGKLLGLEWQRMDPALKDEYQRQHEEEKARYLASLQE